MTIQSVLLFDGTVDASYSFDGTNAVGSHDIGHLAECYVVYETTILADGSPPPVFGCVGFVSFDNVVQINVVTAESNGIVGQQIAEVEQHAGDPSLGSQLFGIGRYIQVAPQLLGGLSGAIAFKATLYYTTDTGLFATP
jgi:hypothetical protein